MNVLLNNIKLKKQRNKLLNLFKLNLLNFKINNLNTFIYIYIVNFNFDDRFFFGVNKSKLYNSKLLIYNKNDKSAISFYFYSPFIYSVCLI